MKKIGQSFTLTPITLKLLNDYSKQTVPHSSNSSIVDTAVMEYLARNFKQEVTIENQQASKKRSKKTSIKEKVN